MFCDGWGSDPASYARRQHVVYDCARLGEGSHSHYDLFTFCYCAGGAPAIVVTGVPWRTGWKYRERGYRHVYWDAGTMLAQTLALADSAGVVHASVDKTIYIRKNDGRNRKRTGAPWSCGS